MFNLGMIAVAAAFQGVVSLTLSDHINITGSNIIISDVVSPEGIDETLYARVADKVVATLPNGKTQIDISRTALAGLVRRRVPLFSDMEIIRGQETIHFEYEPYTETKIRQCKMAKVAIAKNAVVLAQDLTSVICQTEASRLEAAKATPTKSYIRYDRQSGVLRAKAEIAVHTYLGRMQAPERKFADTGDELVLMVKIGPVRIERPVWAAQPAHKANHIFVKDKDGTLLRVPVMDGSSEIKKMEIGK